MSRVSDLRPDFVDEIPKTIDAGVLYISIPYTTAMHLCCCGCGTKVVTPIRPKRWHLTFDGERVSLSPSVGNWSFPCRSHYWVDRSRIRWASPMSDAEVAVLRAADRERRIGATTPRPDDLMPTPHARRRSFLDRLLRRSSPAK